MSVLYMLIVEGGSRLSRELFTELPPAGFELGGGFGNAIVGTLVMLAIAAAISIPIGVLAAVYLSELGPNNKLGQTSRFLARSSPAFRPSSPAYSSTPWWCSPWAPIRRSPAASRPRS